MNAPMLKHAAWLFCIAIFLVSEGLDDVKVASTAGDETTSSCADAGLLDRIRPADASQGAALLQHAAVAGGTSQTSLGHVEDIADQSRTEKQTGLLHNLAYYLGDPKPVKELPECRGDAKKDHSELSTATGDDFLVPICGAIKGGPSDKHHHQTTGICLILIVPALLAVGCLTSYLLNRYLPILPYTCVLFFEGFLLALWRGYLMKLRSGEAGTWRWDSWDSAYTLLGRADPHLILYIFLPVLIFGESMSLNSNMVAHCLPQCLLFAGPGVFIGTVLTGAAAKYILPYGWDWPTAMLLGSILAATDPVAVVGIFKAIGVSPRLTMLVSGESLLNDGVAIVLFQLFIEMMQGVTPTAMGIAKFFGWMTTIGPLFGMGLGLVAVSALGACSDHGGLATGLHGDAMIQVVITFACAYLAFFLAESELHTSGVLSLVACGVTMGSYAWPRFNSRETVKDIWHVMDYMGNTLIFMLAGVILGDIVATRSHIITPLDVLYLLVIYLCCTLIRAFMVAVIWLPANAVGEPISAQEAAVMVWSGLRGAVGLLMAVVADQSPGITEEAGTRILFYVGGMAALMLMVNGTLTPQVLSLCGFRDTTREQRTMLLEIEDRLAAKTRAELDEALHLETKPFLWEGAQVSQIPAAVSLLTDATTASCNMRAITKRGEKGNDGLNKKLMDLLRDTIRNIAKSVYWEMCESGLLPRTSTITQVVMNCADIDRMSRDTELNAWAHLARRLRLGKFLDEDSYDRRVTFKNVIARFLFCCRKRRSYQSYCSRCVLATLSFIHAHEEAIEKIAGYWGMKTPEEERIYDEVEAQIVKAKKFLEEMPEDLVSTVKTKLMASKLLHSQMAEIRTLAETGVITEENAEHLLHIVEEDVHKNWHGWNVGWDHDWDMD